MLNYYKIAYNINNSIKDLYVFVGDTNIDELNTILKIDINNYIFDDIFSDKERIIINSKKVNVIFVNELINRDDTIETVKKKIIENLKDTKVSFEEVYCYSKNNFKATSVDMFKQLTQNNTINLTLDNIEKYLTNINLSYEIENEKEYYDYNDIIDLQLESKNLLKDIPLGQHIAFIKTQLEYIVNPYNVKNYDFFITNYANDLISTNNNELLFNYNIDDNIIYFCLADDVLNNNTLNNVDIATTIKLYFPYLFKKDIISYELFKKEQINLIQETDAIIADSKWVDTKRSINLLNNISQKYKYDFFLNGINHLKFIIHNDSKIILPLDIIFKLLNSSIEAPLIKYNPSKKQENIYRLFCDKQATNGKKIPYLQKKNIFRIIKTIGKTTKVSIYIENYIDNNDEYIILNFNKDSTIEIEVNYTKLYPIGFITNNIKEKCNYLIENVRDYLQQSGYNLNIFSSLRDNNIEIININYSILANITKNINLNKIIGCISPVFNVLSTDINKGAILRYKRVNNYNIMTSQEAYIIDMINTGNTPIEIKTGLVNNFKIKSFEEAGRILSQFLSNIQIVQNAFENKKLKIKNNPGFKTTITRIKEEKQVVISIENIDNIKYIDLINNYIKCILIISQTPEIIDKKYNISKFCKNITDTDNDAGNKILDIIGNIENKQNKLENLTIEDNKIILENIDNDNNEDEMLNLMFDDDDDDDDDDDEDDDDDVVENGDHYNVDDDNKLLFGGNDEDKIEKNIQGKSLTYPNVFSDRLEEREPTLFVKKNTPGFQSYSRQCQWNIRRQPVILTDSEKKRIDKEHPGSYDQSISYKTSKDKAPNHYICPRYWSMTKNVSLTEKEAKSGKYGKIIPADAKVIPTDAEIFEFTSYKHIGLDGKYIKMYPGFLDPKKNPNGKCMPCCFSSWNKPAQIKRRMECAANEKPEKTEKTEKPEKPEKPEKIKKQKKPKFDEYIKSEDKYPLDINRLGFLPLNIQTFLYSDNTKCQISLKNTNLKKNHPCLLRIGAEQSTNQSFIGAISSIYKSEQLTSEYMLTIREFKDKLIEMINLDLFIGLQNGNLIELFDNIKDIDYSKYEDSNLYKSININVQEQLNIFKKAARSCSAFIEYLNDDNIEIDYRYLWDLICLPNKNLFNKGVNLVILELVNDDITRNVNVICPTNVYSNSYFDINKKIIMVLKQDNFYEPIISYTDTDKKIITQRQFSLKYRNLMPNLKKSLDTIRKHLNEKCIPLDSKPNVYMFKNSILLSNLINKLNKKKINIKNQVMNYNNKIVGLNIIYDDKELYIPCFPSSHIENVEIIFIDELKGNLYQITRDYLNIVNDLFKSDNTINCKPVFKVIDDNLIVGILTETNQFIPISQPEQDVYGDDLQILNNYNYINTDKHIINNTNVDNERNQQIKMINLESQFYNIFRNIVRLLLSKIKNLESKNLIEIIIGNKEQYYDTKLKEIIEIIKDITKGVINFKEYSISELHEINIISNCFTNNINTCNNNIFCEKNYNICSLMIPKYNLINNLENEMFYYTKIADELIRYNLIRTFILEPNNYLNITDTKYNLNENEIILLESLLSQDYFDDIIEKKTNKYISSNTFDLTQPINTVKYSDKINFVDIDITSNIDNICEKPTYTNKITGIWNKAFNKNISELIFNTSHNICSFDLIKILIQYSNPEYYNISVNEIKNILLDEYNLLYDIYHNQVLSILNLQGKKHFVKMIKTNLLNFENMIINNDYYMTNLDLIILANKFKIPIILYSSTKLIENNQQIFVINNGVYTISDFDNNIDDIHFFFIKSSGVKTDSLSEYRLLFSSNNKKSKISLSNCKKNFHIRIKHFLFILISNVVFKRVLLI